MKATLMRMPKTRPQDEGPGQRCGARNPRGDPNASPTKSLSPNRERSHLRSRHPKHMKTPSILQKENTGETRWTMSSISLKRWILGKKLTKLMYHKKPKYSMECGSTSLRT